MDMLACVPIQSPTFIAYTGLIPEFIGNDVRLAVALPMQIVTILRTLCGMVRGVGGSPAAKGRGSHGFIRPYHSLSAAT